MSASIPVLVERDNVNDETIVLTRWFVSTGTMVECGQLIAEIETSKAAVEIHAPASGFIQYTAKEQANIAVGAALCFIVQESPLSLCTEEVQQKSNGSTTNRLGHGEALERQREYGGTSHREARRARFSRRAAELAQNNGLNSEMFPQRTLIRERDVRSRLNGVSVGVGEDHSSGREMQVADTARRSPFLLPHRVEKLSARKRTEIRQISIGAKNSFASSVTVACPTRGMRRALERSPALAGSIGVAAVFEVSRLLRKYPTFNAVYRSDTICIFDQVNVGFAVDDGRGLKVPVIRECDQLALSEISTKMRELTVAYLGDHLSPEDLTSGTFTISDLSTLGVNHFDPLISGDQSAILGISGEIFLPDAKSGSYHLTLVFDHQLSDGRTAALFLNELRDRLQSYENTLGSGESEGEAQFRCTRCLRSAGELNDMGGSLLRSASPDGYICSICILGY